jgi:hypothetical protein
MYLVVTMTKSTHSLTIICPSSRSHTPTLGSQFILEDLSLCLPTFVSYNDPRGSCHGRPFMTYKWGG